MKVAVECQSPLLQKSLEMFLEKYISTTKQCDILIRDEECIGDERCFYISSSPESDLMKPFSKSQLILALESRYNTLHVDTGEEVVKEQKQQLHLEYGSMDFNVLEKRIEMITKEYQKDILQAVRAFYEE